MRNKKGLTLLAVWIAIAYFMFGMITYQLLKPTITITRDSNHLNCAAPDTSGDKLTCLLIGGVIPLFIITILSIAGGIITERLT